MQSFSSRIWTRVAVFISYGDNHYTTVTSPASLISPTSLSSVTKAVARKKSKVRSTAQEIPMDTSINFKRRDRGEGASKKMCSGPSHFMDPLVGRSYKTSQIQPLPQQVPQQPPPPPPPPFISWTASSKIPNNHPNNCPNNRLNLLHKNLILFLQQPRPYQICHKPWTKSQSCERDPPRVFLVPHLSHHLVPPFLPLWNCSR